MARFAGLLVLFFALCPFQAHATGAETRVITVGSGSRSYGLYQPLSLMPHAPTALVIVLHGGFGSGAQAEKEYHWDEMAERKGFVVAYPDGAGRSWNAGGSCCGRAQRDNIDDIDFITKIIEDVSRVEKIDPQHVYLTGMSNGAAMAYNYGCAGAYPIAAIGSVSGDLAFDCKTPHPVSVMEIHGLSDQNIPINGGVGTKGVSKVNWMPVAQNVDRFRRADQCQSPISNQSGLLHTATSICPDGRAVTLVTISGAGHQWPGARPRTRLAKMILPSDPPSTAMDATATLWDFFEKHPAPSPQAEAPQEEDR